MHLSNLNTPIKVLLESCPPGGTRYVAFELCVLVFLLAAEGNCPTNQDVVRRLLPGGVVAGNLPFGQRVEGLL